MLAPDPDLLAGVLACPEDDAPRLVLADWFEERGEVGRGEFIRVQVELAAAAKSEPPKHHYNCRPPAGSPLCARCEWLLTYTDRLELLRRRERNLLHKTIFWGLDLPFPAHPDNGHCVWSRGFVSHITCPLDVFLRHAGAVFAGQPVGGSFRSALSLLPQRTSVVRPPHATGSSAGRCRHSNRSSGRSPRV